MNNFTFPKYDIRATNGFLASLLRKWAEDGCCHETEIVFFARHYYPTNQMEHQQNIAENFPLKWRKQVQRLDDHHVFIDFYHSIIVPSKLTDASAYIIQKCREVIINWERTTTKITVSCTKAK